MSKNGLALMVLAGLAIAPAASAQTLGPRAGWFFPTDGTLRDTVGDNWFSFGFGPVDNEYTSGLKDVWDVTVLNRDRNGNKMFVSAFTYGYQYSFGDSRDQSAVPYIAARVGPTYMDYSLTNPNDNVRYSTKRGGLNTNFEAGVLFNRTFQLSLRYDWMNSFDGFNFSGWSIQGEWELVRF